MADNNVNSNQTTNTEVVSPESTSNTSTSIQSFAWLKQFESISGVSIFVLLGVIVKLVIYYYTMGKFDYWGISRTNLVVFGDVIDGFLFGGLALVITFTNFFLLTEWEVINGEGFGFILKKLINLLKLTEWEVINGERFGFILKKLINLLKVYNFTTVLLLALIIPPAQQQKMTNLTVIVVIFLVIVLMRVLSFINLGEIKKEIDYVINVVVFIFLAYGVCIAYKNERGNFFGYIQNQYGSYLIIVLGTLLCFVLLFLLKFEGIVDTEINEKRKSYRFFVITISLSLILVYYVNFNYQRERMSFSFVEHENFIVLHENREQLYGVNYEIYRGNNNQELKLLDTSKITVKDKLGEKIFYSDEVNRKQIVRKNNLNTLVKEVGKNEGEIKTIFLNDKNWIMVYEDKDKDKEYYYANSYVEQENKIIINIDDRMFFEKNTLNLKFLSLEGKQVEFTNKNIEG